MAGMSFTPTNPRTFSANTGVGIKLTPNSSPYPRTPRPRSPNKNRTSYEAGLSLKRIIGTTVTLPTGFDSLPSARIFAYVAGAAVVVVQLEEGQNSQRFFRAHPTAIAAIPHTASAPSTPVNTANDSRNRTLALREASAGPPSTPTHSRAAWSDSPLSKTWSSRERIKAATCLSISRDGQFLAVGETGYTPRVLIFNLHESSDVPIVILNEHTFGVTAVAFSPDGRYLATLGSPNDGFLYMWSISSNGAARLHASNKCTSFVRCMVWMGNSLITVGTRHVKVWRLDDNASSPSKTRFNLDGSPSIPTTVTRTLSGRNCLLGCLLDAVFTCAASISETKAIVCSENGDICLIDDNDGQNQLVKVAHAGFAVTCISVDVQRRSVRVGGRSGAMKTITFDDLLTPSTPPASPCEEDFNYSDMSIGNLCAMAVMDGYVVTVDSRHAIKITKDGSDSPLPFLAHRDSVLGVSLLGPNSIGADFFSWDSAGNVLFWDLEGQCKGSFQINLEQAGSGEEDVVNQCLVVRASGGGTFFVAGDKYGVLRILDTPDFACSFVAKAHNSDIEDIAIHEGKGMTLVATCGRDRTVQLFKKVNETWVLLQTMDEHTGSVGRVCFCDDGDKIMSSSSDRTIQIRQIASKEIGGQEVIAAIPIRVITLKATPISMTLSSNDPATSSLVVVSTMDRTVATFEISTGKLISSFKASDGEGNDAVVMDSLVMAKPISGRPMILAGVSGTDKSVRIYDGRSGSFLDRGFGHTASVTDVALFETAEQTTLISTGSDSTIMIWDVTTRTPEIAIPPELSLNQDDSLPAKELTSNMPPLRRILSRAELAEFSRQSPSTPTGRSSPPRTLRRKTSKYSIHTNSPKLAVPPIPSMPASAQYASSLTDEPRRAPPRTRSRSPPPSPKSRSSKSGPRKQPSLVDLRGRTKSASTAGFADVGGLNTATEQVCRTLRAYRKKLTGAEAIKEDGLKELDLELRLTAQAVLEKSLKTRKISEAVLAGLLDQYSERLVSIFDEKLRLSLNKGVKESRDAVGSPTASGPAGAPDDTSASSAPGAVAVGGSGGAPRRSKSKTSDT